MADPLRRTLSKLRGRRSQRGAAAGAGHRHGGVCAPQDLIENVYIASRSRKEPKCPQASEVPEHRPQVNSITVSKKRSWLQQSTHRRPPPPLEEENTCKEVHGAVIPVPKSPIPLPEPAVPWAPSTSPVGQERPVRGCPMSSTTSPATARSTALDLGEDNDADDEGEIWYNPIPEDDEPDLPGVHPSAANSLVAVGSPSVRYKPHPGGDSGMATSPHDGPTRSMESIGNNWTVQPGEGSQADAAHPGDHVQQHRQKFACKAPSMPAAEDNPAFKCPSTGFGAALAPKADIPSTEVSPPSPSPLKKSGSINWPFPDRIKSPRTVRKLSMKMKKLPELSRKLSVKGTSSHSSSDNPPSLLKGSCRDTSHTVSLPSSGNSATAASRNVISRYHLDSSVSSQHTFKKKSSRSSKSFNKGGYLSDGDSPELITKSGKHRHETKCGKGKESLPSNSGKTEIDIDAFRHYNFSDQPRCSQYISGLMSIHFYGAEDLKPPRIDSKDVFCAIQVDSVNKARTALLTCRTTFLDMDHTFNIEIENAQHLKLVVFSWEPTPRKNRVCCHGTVALPTLFRVTKTHQLAVKLEPRGLIYVKLSLMEQWENSLDGLDADREPVMFGVDARKVVEKENAGLMVPLLLQKCILEIEKRGCQVVGLYRLCGSAAVKKELREAFERDSKAVTLCESQYPDINVITVHHSPAKEPAHLNAFPEHPSSLNYLRPKRQRPQMLNLSGAEVSGVLRPRPAGLDSPSSNRYAGDWSSCGENYFLNPKDCLSEADYDDVPSEDTESGDDSSKAEELDAPEGRPQPVPGEHTFQSYLTVQAIDSAVDHRANLKDLQESIDTLIGNLERELNKNKLNMSY
ncbi:rho GTPase-activating protein SYDE2 isoform X2 [Neopelma chrysocephalum]|uniref:rho GTPase-activating protein SYDE2 isoform X2 n=1 Tax=Neopelma chrysocephalum TaxID=114329 RepID=UPI000FCD211D|nr:rho GTPase-activating protein SYDE2 isoform X2 [Neopelma chrysocephalum]